MNRFFVKNSFFSFLIISLFVGHANAGIIVSSSTPVVEVSADNASNALVPAFTRLGEIIIMEKGIADFASTAGKSKSLVLTAPAGWTFKPLSGNISCKGKDLKEVSLKTSAKTITINFIVNSTTSIDAITISGIEVQSANGSIDGNTGCIHRSAENPGTAKISGITTSKQSDGSDGTVFAKLSQTAGVATKLVFATKPAASSAGVAFEQQPVVAARDQFGNQTSAGLDENQVVKIKLSSGSGVLSGTLTMNIGTGIAIFSDLQVDEMGSKKLIATSGNLSFAVSNEINITKNESSQKISSEDADDYDPDWICFLPAAGNNSTI